MITLHYRLIQDKGQSYELPQADPGKMVGAWGGKGVEDKGVGGSLDVLHLHLADSLIQSNL